MRAETGDGVCLRWWVVAAIVLSTVVAACADNAKPDGAADDAVLVVAAGDIACHPENPAYNDGEGTATECRQKHTSELILEADHVFVLGDSQYWNGAIHHFEAVFDKTWGRKKSVMYPTPGNHEYDMEGAAGYFEYFDVAEYYSFDIGSWHWISLNSEIDHSSSSEQVEWLRQDLAGTDQPCIGAFWHRPRFASGGAGSEPSLTPFWEELYKARADIVLAGHSHAYERFAKQSPDGEAAGDGLRQFVVGTGGRSLYRFPYVKSNSEAQALVFGVLALRLYDDRYEWEFRIESGGEFTDEGGDSCHG